MWGKKIKKKKWLLLLNYQKDLLHWIITISCKLSNAKCRLLGIKIFLKLLNYRFTSTDVLKAYFKCILSEGDNSKFLKGCLPFIMSLIVLNSILPGIFSVTAWIFFFTTSIDWSAYEF
jgi:hypothetical protein